VSFVFRHLFSLVLVFVHWGISSSSSPLRVCVGMLIVHIELGFLGVELSVWLNKLVETLRLSPNLMPLSTVTYVTWPDFSSYTLSEQKGYKNNLPFWVVARANQAFLS